MKEYSMNKKENRFSEENIDGKKVYCSPKLVEIGSVQKKTFGTKDTPPADGPNTFAHS